MTHPKVKAHHLQRKAIIYIRQSSLHQVLDHRESQRRQYQLIELATALGWPESACEVIDDDQALSATSSHNRPGYQRLTAMVALREVGLIIGMDVSRLARNCLDWYELLQVATIFDVLVADEEGLYDLSQFNDRLLLGLKGIFAEAEVHQIQARMVAARMSKAQRGELRFRLPVGLEWDPLTHKPRLTSDQAVREAIALVFRLFAQLGTIRAVLRYLRSAGLDLPYQSRERTASITWRRPSDAALRALLINPLYAGAYCYGRRQVRPDPQRHVIHRRSRPRAEWRAFLPEHFTGYLTWEEYEANQRRLANNAYQFPRHQGAAREGRALVQGLAVCAHCGRRMHVRYSGHHVRYLCDLAHLSYEDPICNCANARHVDGMIAHLFLQLLTTNTLELALSFQDQLQEDTTQREAIWRQKLTRLEYEAKLARRRYEAVDPENRLVAQTLESEWNLALQTVADAQAEYQAHRATPTQLASTLEQMRGVLAHLPDYWFSPTLSVQDKKELVRAVIEQVVIDGRGELIRVQLHWYGGSVSELALPKRLQTPAWVYLRIQELARTLPDHTIAERLNDEGHPTAYKRTWTEKSVQAFRHAHGILSQYDANPQARHADVAPITSQEAAQRLGVKADTIQEWCRLGILPYQQRGENKRLWVEWQADLAYRLSGSASLEAGMVAVRDLCQSWGWTRRELFAWLHAHPCPIYRIQRGRRKPFYLLLPETSDPQM